MKDKLKACPFCGGEAKIHFENGFEFRSIFYYVSCEKCGCRTDANTESEELAIKTWGARAIQIPSVEELEETIKKFSRNSGDYVPDYKFKDLAKAIHDKLGVNDEN